MAEDAYVNKYLGSNGVKLLWDQINSRNASYISYDKDDKHIRLWASKDSNGNYANLLDEFDASVFIQDSFLKNIEIVEATTDKPININGSQVTSGKYFKFTFNTYSDEGEQEVSLIYVSLADIGGTNFETGNGIGINDNDELYVKANSNEFTFGDDQELTINSINATKSKTTENIRILEGPLANNINEEGDLYWPETWFIKDENGEFTDKKCIPEGLDLQQIIKNLFYVFKHGTVTGQGSDWTPKCVTPTLSVHKSNDANTKFANNVLVEIGTNVTGTAKVFYSGNYTTGSVKNLTRSYTFTEMGMNGETLEDSDPHYGLWLKSIDESGEETWTRVTTGATTKYTPTSGEATIVMGEQKDINVTYTPQLSYLTVTDPDDDVKPAENLVENNMASKGVNIQLEKIGVYTFSTQTKGYGVKMTSLINNGNEIVIRPGTNEDVVYMAEEMEAVYMDETKGSVDTSKPISPGNPYYKEASPSDTVSSSVKSVYGIYTTGNVYKGDNNWNYTSIPNNTISEQIYNDLNPRNTFPVVHDTNCTLVDSSNESFEAVIDNNQIVYKITETGQETIGNFDAINGGQVAGWDCCRRNPIRKRLNLKDISSTTYLYVNFPNDPYNNNDDKTFKYILLPNTLKIAGISMYNPDKKSWISISDDIKATGHPVSKFTNDATYDLTNYTKYTLTGNGMGTMNYQLTIQKNN